jgi:hypothetical protein
MLVLAKSQRMGRRVMSSWTLRKMVVLAFPKGFMQICLLSPVSQRHPSTSAADLSAVRAVYPEMYVMSNASLTVTIEKGRIISIVDRALEYVTSKRSSRVAHARCSKELIAEGMSGGMVIMEDHPNYWE